MLRRAGKHRMAECVQAGFVRGDFLAGHVFHAFADDDHAIFMFRDRFLDAFEEGGLVQPDFRQQDDMRGVTGSPLGEHRAGGNPARRPAHDFNQTARAIIGRHAFHVGGDLPSLSRRCI